MQTLKRQSSRRFRPKLREMNNNKTLLFPAKECPPNFFNFLGEVDDEGQKKIGTRHGGITISGLTT